MSDAKLRWTELERDEDGDMRCSLKRGRKTVLHVCLRDGDVWRCYWYEPSGTIVFNQLPKRVTTPEAAKRAAVKQARADVASRQKLLNELKDNWRLM